MIGIAFFLAAAAPEYLILDTRSASVVESHWESVEQAAPMGSLIKPFTALAYAQTHEYRYPQIVCRSCWQPRGHGLVRIREAVGHSCNTYFRELARKTPPSALTALLRRFGVGGLSDDVAPDALAGLASSWKISPLAMARAYAELAARSGEPGVAPLLEGMALAARSGTGKAVGRPLRVKTGTAECAHARGGPGDGYLLVLFDSRVLLLRVHGTTGAEAARVAGRMLLERPDLH